MSKPKDKKNDYVRLDTTVESDRKTLDIETRSIEFIMSTTAVDSYGEIVVQDWDLSAYEKNPVVLYGHNWYGRTAVDSLPIGRMENVGVVKGKLKGRVFFATEKANPMGELVWNGILEDTIRAGSVGFRTTVVTTKKLGDRELVYLSGNILKEFSITPIGANPDAVSLGDAGDDARETREQQFSRLAAKAERDVPDGRDHDKDNVMDEKEKQELSDLRRRAAEQDAVIEKAAKDQAERERADAEANRLKAEALEAERATIKAESDRLKAENETLRVKAVEARTEVVKSEAQALVGKTLVPAQVDAYVKLAMSDDPKVQEAFKSFVDGLAPLTITTPKIKSGGIDENADPTNPAPRASGLSLVRRAQQGNKEAK